MPDLPAKWANNRQQTEQQGQLDVQLTFAPHSLLKIQYRDILHLGIDHMELSIDLSNLGLIDAGRKESKNGTEH